MRASRALRSHRARRATDRELWARASAAQCRLAVPERARRPADGARSRRGDQRRRDAAVFRLHDVVDPERRAGRHRFEAQAGFALETRPSAAVAIGAIRAPVPTTRNSIDPGALGAFGDSGASAARSRSSTLVASIALTPLRRRQDRARMRHAGEGEGARAIRRDRVAAGRERGRRGRRVHAFSFAFASAPAASFSLHPCRSVSARTPI